MQTKNILIGGMILIIIVLSFTMASIIKKDNQIIREYQNKIIELKVENIKIENQKIMDFYMLRDVTVTAYSPSIEETDSTPNQTAIMEKPIIGYTCAVSRDLKYLLGKRIYIEGMGVFKVNDLMNKRYTERIDLCMNKESAIKFGIQTHHVVIVDE